MPFILQIILFLFFFAFTFVSYRDLKKGIYATIFFMPLYLVRFSVAGIPTTVLEIMIYILFGLWLLENRRKIKSLKNIKDFYFKDKIFFFGVLLLFLGVIFSTINSINLRTSLGVLKGWFLDPFLFFIIFTDRIKTEKQAVSSLFSFILSGFITASAGLFYALNGVFTFDGRLRAFYESPNYLAMYLAPGFLFAAYFFVFQKDILKNICREEEKKNSKNKIYNLLKNKKIQVVILSVFVFALLLTKSYGTFLGIVAALVLFVAKKYKTQKIQLSKNSKKIIFAFLIFLFIFFSFASYQKYEQIINSNERSSLHSRLMIWNASLEMLKDSPALGIGPGTFQEMYLDYQSRFSVPYLEWAVAEPHNTLLAFYLESGAIGFIGFILILFWLIKRARYDDIIFLFLVYFLVHGLVDTLYWKNDLALIFWFLLGIAMFEQGKTVRFSSGFKKLTARFLSLINLREDS